MKFVGMLRIKNEARWIGEVIESMLPLCDRLFILDDHSTDDTVDICRSHREVTLFRSPFEGLNETRDKNYLLQFVEASGADYCMCQDGDEVLEADGPAKIRELCASHQPQAVYCKVLYLWNDEQTIRVDGIYDRIIRPSLFRISPGLQFRETYHGGNLHCSSVPGSLIPQAIPSDVRLWHYGYIDADLRARKYEWYNRVDPSNEHEDCYRHVVQGDAGGPPADVQLKHAGPLRLVSLI